MLAEKILRSRQRFRCAMAGGVALVVVAGATDYIYHDYEPFIRWNMKQNLRKCTTPSITSRLQPDALQAAGPPLRLSAMPTAVGGPIGVGKTEVLARAALEATSGDQPSPAVFVLCRFSYSYATEPEPPHLAAERMAFVVQSVCPQIGYPTQSSLIGALLALYKLLVDPSQAYAAALMQPANRLRAAFNTLFRACDELHQERLAAGVSPDAAPCRLLLDGVADLASDDGLKAVGGTAFFDDLAANLAEHGAYRKAVFAAVSGNSEFAWGRPSSSDPRWQHYEVEDPSREVVAADLERRGFSESQIRKMLDDFGTRMLLLKTPLACKASDRDNVSSYVATQSSPAASCFYRMLHALPQEARCSVVRAMDRLAAGETVVVKDLPKDARLGCLLSRVLYLRADNTVTFQSRLQERVWMDKEERAGILAAIPAAREG